ncbi:DUF3800 domain-containing protein [bacterium]|nr:DUF3800 domain-containing protein [bacterium]
MQKTISDEQLRRLSRVYYLYLDEFGHATFSPKLIYNRSRERFLTIAGFLIRGDHWWTELCPRLESLKARHFGDPNIALHYSEFAQGIGTFGQFSPSARLTFWSEFLDMLAGLPCQLVSLTIDKETMQKTYSTWLHDPYHLLVAFHVERLLFHLFKLDRENPDSAPRFTGKLIIESRGEKPDRRLGMWYRRVYSEGSKIFQTISARQVQERLESAELTVVSKKESRKGLEVADMICNPMHWNAMFEFRSELVARLDGVEAKTPAVSAFWDKLRHKIASDENGNVLGYGIKIFPDAT